MKQTHKWHIVKIRRNCNIHLSLKRYEIPLLPMDVQYSELKVIQNIQTFSRIHMFIREELNEKL